MRISYFPNEQAKTPRGIEVSWEQLAAQLQACVRTPCTLADCPGKSCGHKLGPAWSPAVYPEGTKRGKRNVSAVSCIVLDLDHMTDEQVLDVAHKLAPYRYIAHATHTDRPGDRCLRVVLELSAPVPGFDWGRFYRTAIAELGIPMADRKADTGGQDSVTFDASRLYFLPSRPNDADYLATTNEGAAVDTAAIMAKAPPPEEPIAPTLGLAAPTASSEELHAAALQLAAVFPAKGRHNTFLALAGALASHGWSEDQISELTLAVAHLLPYDTAKDKEKALNDRPQMARDSVAKVQRGEQVTGWGTLAQALTRPEAVDFVRERLSMRDPAEVAIDAVFGPLSVPNSSTDVPDSGISSGYPSLDALAVLDVPRAPLMPEVPLVPTAPAGTYAYEVQRARIEIASALGSDSAPRNTANDAPLFFAAREMFVKTYGPTPWLVQGLIVEGGIAAIIGEPKSAKSWLAIDIAACVASGSECLSKFKVPRPMRTAYFFAEDLEQSIRNRLRAFAAGRGMRPEDFASNLFVQPRGRHLDVTKDEDLASLVASCRMIGQVGLLVLDPLRDIHTGKENESDAMSAVFARLRLLGTLVGCTVLVVHHAKKPSKDQEETRAGHDARGSSAIYGSLDALIALRDLQEDGTTFTNAVKTEVKGAKGAGSFHLTLKLEDGSDGTAERATWTHGKPQSETGASVMSEVMADCLQHILTCEIRKDRVQTTELIRKAVSRKLEIVVAALIEAERSGLALKNMVGSRHVGWLITEMGRQYVRDANKPAEQTAETPGIPTQPTPSAAPLEGVPFFDLSE